MARVRTTTGNYYNHNRNNNYNNGNENIVAIQSSSTEGNTSSGTSTWDSGFIQKHKTIKKNKPESFGSHTTATSASSASTEISFVEHRRRPKGEKERILANYFGEAGVMEKRKESAEAAHKKHLHSRQQKTQPRRDRSHAFLDLTVDEDVPQEGESKYDADSERAIRSYNFNTMASPTDPAYRHRHSHENQKKTATKLDRFGFLLSFHSDEEDDNSSDDDDSDNEHDDSDEEITNNTESVSSDFIYKPLKKKHLRLVSIMRRKSNNNKRTDKRTEKWAKMIRQWDLTQAKKKKKLKRRIRKGIPDGLRGKAWSLMGRPVRTGEYEKLLRRACAQNRKQTQGSSASASGGTNPSGEVFKDTIERDINRTYPRHLLFHMGKEMVKAKEQGPPHNNNASPHKHKKTDRTVTGAGIFDCNGLSKQQLENIQDASQDDEDDLMTAVGGQASLRRVLQAYSILDPEVGYCQGMNFIGAMFLTFMTEEEAYWLLVTVIYDPPCRMRGLFEKGMAEAQQVLHVADFLLKQFLPRLHTHFERENVHITMYATQWLLTVYSSVFNFDLVTRVWDCFLYEGWKIAYRVMLAILALYEEELLEQRFEDILGFMKELPQKVNGDDVMHVAFAIPVKTKHIEKYKNEWLAMNQNGAR